MSYSRHNFLVKSIQFRKPRGISCWSSVQDSMLSLEGAWVRSMLRNEDLSSCFGAAKTNTRPPPRGPHPPITPYPRQKTTSLFVMSYLFQDIIVTCGTISPKISLIKQTSVSSVFYHYFISIFSCLQIVFPQAYTNSIVSFLSLSVSPK